MTMINRRSMLGTFALTAAGWPLRPAAAGAMRDEVWLPESGTETISVIRTM